MESAAHGEIDDGEDYHAVGTALPPGRRHGDRRGYLVWLWLRESRGWLLGALGGLILFLYGVVPTLQPAHFGRVYAAYGGVFVVLSLLWGWWVDGNRPDRPEIVGALLCVVGVVVIMYWPRA